MDAKFGNFSEMANLLSVKSRVSSDLMLLFARFSLGHLLYRLGMRIISPTHHGHMHVSCMQ